MHLSRSFAVKLIRSAGVCLIMLASLTLVDSVVLAQAAATPKVNPADWLCRSTMVNSRLSTRWPTTRIKTGLKS
jgi:hypothetical protein